MQRPSLESGRNWIGDKKDVTPLKLTLTRTTVGTTIFAVRFLAEELEEEELEEMLYKKINT